jgi:hypothetical protein
MAGDGHLIFETSFKRNTINQRYTGDGVIHARAKTQAEVDDIKKELTDYGMKVEVAKKYKPLWKF